MKQKCDFFFFFGFSVFWQSVGDWGGGGARKYV
jgi:hypothetical protein